MVIEPVLLSLCCYQLNRRRAPGSQIDKALVLAAGQDILDSFYREALADPEVQGRPDVALFIEDYLIQGDHYRGDYPAEGALGEHRITSRQLAALTDRHRLLRIVHHTDTTRVELIHDRLVPGGPKGQGRTENQAASGGTGASGPRGASRARQGEGPQRRASAAARRGGEEPAHCLIQPQRRRHAGGGESCRDRMGMASTEGKGPAEVERRGRGGHGASRSGAAGPRRRDGAAGTDHVPGSRGVSLERQRRSRTVAGQGRKPDRAAFRAGCLGSSSQGGDHPRFRADTSAGLQPRREDARRWWRGRGDPAARR